MAASASTMLVPPRRWQRHLVTATDSSRSGRAKESALRLNRISRSALVEPNLRGVGCYVVSSIEVDPRAARRKLRRRDRLHREARRAARVSNYRVSENGVLLEVDVLRKHAARKVSAGSSCLEVAGHDHD